ncbi:MAG: phosphatase domain-containing protein [Actinomycetota bacterium]|nr:phosphatase domain-containing protein [Actinomycetota bacterium]
MNGTSARSDGDGDGNQDGRGLVHEIAYRAEQAWEWARARFAGPPERLTVVPYLAHGTSERVIARGRVLTNRPVVAASGPEAWWQRVKRMYRRFATDEVPGVELRLRLGRAVAEATTDDEGYYRAVLTAPGVDTASSVHEMIVEVVDPPEDTPVEVLEARAMIPAATSTRMLVSDIDDTVLQSGAMRTAELILTTATGSAFTRSWFPGVAELYRGLTGGTEHTPANPVVYVSSSPWNLYDFLTAFIRRSALPDGPLFLRDLGVDADRFVKGSHSEHKRAAIDEILDTYDLPLVLSGDTGQHDPEIYRDVADAHPGRIEAVLLRHVAGDARKAEVEAMWEGSGVMVAVADTSTELARVAADAGLIPPDEVDRVRDAETRTHQRLVPLDD